MSSKSNTKSTDIRLVLDASGSMGPIAEDVRGGINSFIEDQKAIKGKCQVSMVQFNHNLYNVYQNKKLKNVPELTRTNYEVGGMTALLDAFGQELSRESKADVTIVVVFTDGYENASEIHTRDTIRRLVKRREDEGWNIVYMGADVDSFGEASDIGVSHVNTMNVDKSSKGFTAAYSSMSKNVGNVRSGTKADMSFEDIDYDAQADLGVKQGTEED